MIYQNIELFNVSELTSDGHGGLLMHRFPLSVEEAFGDQGKRMNIHMTGVEFRFRANGPVKLRLKMADPSIVGTLYVYQGSILRDWANAIHRIYGDRITEIVINPPENPEKVRSLQQEGDFPFSHELTRLVFNSGRAILYDIEGDCEPPHPEDTPKRTYLAYGSSITHGSSALIAPYTYPFVTAENLDMDLRNLGMAGSCHMEPEVADHIAEMGRRGEWDVATLCMGINVASWELPKIEERVDYMIRTIADANPEKHVFCISPMFSGIDINGENKLNVWREAIDRLVAAHHSPFVHYVNGLSLLDSARGLSADRVHPSPRGARQIAANLTAEMRKFV